MKWQKIRMLLLALTCIGVLANLGKLIVEPEAGNHKVTEFNFPTDVPLIGSKMLESKPLIDTVIQQPRKYDSVISGRVYHYTQNGISLNIEMRYVLGTLGNVEGFITQKPDGKLFQSIRKQQGIGFYGLFVAQNKAYLTSCINSRGGSTVTIEQFLQNRRSYDLDLSRLQPWLFGQQSLTDRRCLWAHLSTPLNKANSNSAYQVLEKAWFFWYRWWSLHFPQH
ncbi:cyanoexosortase A system-associated protein [Aetokthonos hydrillicola Thurmond2011]|jgi:cyanosortase A-associated protein|uniref:Cyanoexosortase A system-associated protein n=1 Tax=Aetokthonos hydrillicola Thurmond2011 TaxID=2712845 RepID=A0AAP5I8B7_9CYAN|nr:cyanoexosortase A system-associated protein [Aetokthonos hydrillicola]MBO3458905.1 cyanoexosortase A system-associated protein [Aetokthonos hydrillicola CCALA 1050]MBW4587246.1 cyanoexosortase A system-associated protein [Aetokthonos hydrillicola CCALA 1050]MDR9896731.1 cyanoexosortase A system-associated protein [Aetokthonos hydrillicola Thurmond2011]